MKYLFLLNRLSIIFGARYEKVHFNIVTYLEDKEYKRSSIYDDPGHCHWLFRGNSGGDY